MVTTSGVHGLTYPTDEEQLVGHTLVIRSTAVRESSTIDATGVMWCTAFRGGGDRQFRSGRREGDRHGQSGLGPLRPRRRHDFRRIGHGAGIEWAGRCHRLSFVRSPRSPCKPARVMPRSTCCLRRTGSPRLQVKETSPWSSQGSELLSGAASSGEGSVSNGVDDDPTSDRVITASSGQGDVTVAYHSR